MSKLNIIWFNGPPKSGKDTCANYIRDKLGINYCLHIKLADPINNALRGLFSHIDEETWTELRESKKDIKVNTLMNKSLRDSFISFSEDWAKNFYGPDIFGLIAAERIQLAIKQNKNIHTVVFSDSGFVEELLAVRRVINNGRHFLIRIHKDGCSYTNDSRSYLSNVCESELDIQNTSFSALFRELDKVLQTILH
jgi:hypothetical protein